MDPSTKLMLAYAVGKRDNATAMEFVSKLRRATTGQFQINADGLAIYRSVIPLAFGRFQDHAQVVKMFGAPVDGEHKYSPGQIIDLHVEVGSGNPDLESACTSHIERSNLTVRMMLRRFTRLTNAHSKSWRHHEAALGLLFSYYNFCRRHMTLKCTPAMAAGLTDHAWSVKELIRRVIPEDARA
jgi:IS1 family transposase